MTSEALKLFKEEAEKIDWKKFNINDLFFEYIKHEHDELGQCFYAGIICRTWGYASRIYAQCNKRLPYDQCYDILIDTISYVLKKRVWENTSSSLHGDSTAPDKAFHIALRRMRGLALAKIMAKKRKSNINSVSMDEIKEEYNDAAEGLFDIGDDTNYNEDTEIREMIRLKQPLQTIILDRVCFSHWCQLKNVVTNIKKLNETNVDYFTKAYGMSRQDYFKSLLYIRNLENPDIMREVKKSLNEVRKQIGE